MSRAPARPGFAVALEFQSGEHAPQQKSNRTKQAPEQTNTLRKSWKSSRKFAPCPRSRERGSVHSSGYYVSNRSAMILGRRIGFVLLPSPHHECAPRGIGPQVFLVFRDCDIPCGGRHRGSFGRRPPESIAGHDAQSDSHSGHPRRI